MENKRVLKILKVVLIIVILIVVLVGIYCISVSTVKDSYSSRDLISNNSEESSTSELITRTTYDVQKYNERTGSNLIPVDYTGRDFFSTVGDEKYFNNRISYLSEINGKDVSDSFVLYGSYYHGDYSEYYKKDELVFLDNYPDIRSLFSKIDNLDSISENLPYLEPFYDGNNIGKMYSLDNISFDNVDGLQFYQLMLVGVLNDRYYIYSDPTKPLNECDTFVILDKKTLVVFKDSITVSELGGLEDVLALKDSTSIFELDGKKIVFTKGY